MSIISKSEKSRLINWRQWKLPKGYEDWAELRPVEVIINMKLNGNLSRILLIHGLPKTTSTPCLRALGTSPSINRQLPLFHETLNEDPERLKHGGDVLVGKLIDMGVLESKNKNLDLVAKIMSHELSEHSFDEVLPHVDGIISTLREPARHLGCVEDEIIKQITFDEDAVYDRESVGQLVTAWWGRFYCDIMKIQELKKHGKIAHELIDGDNLVVLPEKTLRTLCTRMQEQRFDLRFGSDMLHSWRQLWDPTNDPWAKVAKSSKGFNNIAYKPKAPEELGVELQNAFEIIQPIYESLIGVDVLAKAPSLDILNSRAQASLASTQRISIARG